MSVTLRHQPDAARLPPGQRVLGVFPRFGKDLTGPPPALSETPVITIDGAVDTPFDVPLHRLAEMPRHTQISDFHCVAGWSALDLRWEGVAFRTFYENVVTPHLRGGAAASHLSFQGLDRVRAVISLDDALADDVLLADHLDGEPLGPDHGAPIRLVSPGQYGYVNIKHLCRLGVHTTKPPEPRSVVELLLRAHPRARVWHEERHGFLPGRIIRPIYGIVRRLLFRLHPGIDGGTPRHGRRGTLWRSAWPAIGRSNKSSHSTPAAASRRLIIEWTTHL